MAEHRSQQRISKLLEGLLGTYEPCFGLGSMTVSIYDTAWIACISKTVSGCSQWLFPSSFVFVLEAQLADGRWPAHPNEDDTDEVDGILSTMAASYCLIQHAKNPLQLRHIVVESLAERINKAVACLSSLLHKWQVEDCKAVGFELLAPSLLNLLEDEGHFLDFPGKEQLLDIRNQKLSRARPETLYDRPPSALLHSLEAFHCRKDLSFDRFAHQKVGGSMMASPSATASYLIRCREWDDEAEAYLRLVVSNGQGKGSGGVPSAYPSTNFELAWTVSTFLETGLWTPGLSVQYDNKILDTLEHSRKTGKGLVGFAPGIEPDLDDSAKSSTIFSLLGRQGFSGRIVEHFDSSQCLKTYRAERNPSVSANCNALLCILLDSEDYPSKYANLSPFYAAMLMTQSLVELLQRWKDGKLPEIQTVLLKKKVVPTLFQCLVHILRSQLIDGSWGSRGPREETAYAILALAKMMILPAAQFFNDDILFAIDCGRSFLRRSQNQKTEYLWIEKVTYGSKALAEAYTIAALYTSTERPSHTNAILHLCCIDSQDLADFVSKIERDPLSKYPKHLVIASWIVARLYVSHLQRNLGGLTIAYRLEPTFRWILAHNRAVSIVSARFIVDMITASLLTDCIVTLVDGAVASGNNDQLLLLKDAFYEAVKTFDKRGSGFTKIEANGAYNSSSPKVTGGINLRSADGDSAREDQHVFGDRISSGCPKASGTSTTISSFVGFFNDHNVIPGASDTDNSTSLTGLPHLLAFATCLVLQKRRDAPPTLPQRYIANEAHQCVTTIAELQRAVERSEHGPFTASRSQATAAIMRYEKERLGLAFQHLEKSGMDAELLGVIKLVADTVDLAEKLSGIEI
ncbi:MAG: hypothetical protein Q9191_004664 [Dirinaria sp. TL-2023a]